MAPTIGTERPDLSGLLASWHDFYAVTGTAASTMVALLFVAASVGTSFYTEERRPAFRTFVSPSVVHFSCALALSLAVLAPLRYWLALGLIEGGLALFGLVYSAIISVAAIRLRFNIDLEDRVWYTALPAVAYALLLTAASLFLARRPSGLIALACGVGLLLLIGIRNAWDMTSFTVIRHRE